MNNTEVVENTMKDLKIGYDLALMVNNDILKDYVQNRMNDIEKNRDNYQYVSIMTLVNSYVVDLSLFINISNVVSEVESKAYFKGRLLSIMKCFPELKDRRDLASLL